MATWNSVCDYWSNDHSGSTGTSVVSGRFSVVYTDSSQSAVNSNSNVDRSAEDTLEKLKQLDQ